MPDAGSDASIAINGGWVVAWGPQGHQVLEGGSVVTEGGRIAFVGFPDDDACPKADRTIDARGMLVSPGLINLHGIANLDVQVFGIDAQGGGGGYNRPASILDPHTPHIRSDADIRTSARFSVATMLKAGNTTFTGVTTGATKLFEEVREEPYALAEASEEMGARAWLAHTYQETCDYTDADGAPRTVWDRQKAQEGLDHAVEFIKAMDNRSSGLVTGFLFPKRTERCSDDLLQETMRQSKALGGVHVRTHFAHSIDEYRGFKAQNPQRTMVEWLRDVGFLGPHLCLTHVLFIAGHSATGDPPGEDLEILSGSNTNVCHCPVVYARGGVFMESFSRYVEAGINMGVGTDTFPPDLLEEMRIGALINKVVDRQRSAGTVRDFYNAATIGGAKALGREDLGRLATGCAADISIFDLSALSTGPADDPMRTLVHFAGRRECHTVMVDGKIVVEGGRVVGVDEEKLGREAREAWGRYKEGLVGWDYAKRPAEKFYPPLFPTESPSSR